VKIVRRLALVILAYVGVVVGFELYLGLAQPSFNADFVKQWDAPVVITTIGEDGLPQDRFVVPMRSDGHLYVSANHWPRSWYRRALENPKVQITSDGETKDYLAVPIPAASEDQDRLERAHPHPAWFRFLTGYPPRRFVRLEPR